MKIEEVASICHEANRQLQRVMGEMENPPWDNLPFGLQQSAIDGVMNAIVGATPRGSHENWLRFKEKEGWTYGLEKDFERKTHPCMVPYNQLPAEQKVKDRIFTAIVDAFLAEGLIEREVTA